jgi:hypothetical protein
MATDDTTKNEAAARRLHEAYIIKVNEAQERGDDRRSTELANDYLAQLRTFPLR